ncbi:CobW family GTP-binding protein [Cohnella sp. JJ-181]|uniref:CobW family GTP-binding protein n=1 Tax=Cohnella rhizoplanae TaxID=2974897 RepID=UPI0022FF790E|nr:CobW family GTP-binding protein [Cohnella sp. JJ-181]CAI6085114.1 Putative metal chaperone YciC [Cohnella sp. JJ-181]
MTAITNENHDRPIQVYVLSGYLGSGKTTLLQKLLEGSRVRGWRTAVLMNEAGEFNLDGELVSADVPMAELLGGCICCSVKNDLGASLLQLAQDHRPDVIWIESTGVAQPLETMDAVTEVSMYEKLELRGLITVVDARHLLDRLRLGAGKTLRLMREQIRGASLLLLSKTDLVGPGEADEVRAQLREWNPSAVLADAVKGETETDLMTLLPGVGQRTERTRPDSHDHHDLHAADDVRESREYRANQDRREHDHGRPRLHDHVHVLTHYPAKPVLSEDFERFLAELPASVYRAKGIVTFTDTRSRYLFQYAYRESDFLPITPQKPVPDVVVLIGEDFSETELRHKLSRLGQPDLD